jgi:hypothetical protein
MDEKSAVQPTPGVHENFAPILDDSGQGSGLWCEPPRDGRDRARDYPSISHQAASAGHARGWRQALDAAAYAATSALSDMIVAGSGDLQEAHGKEIEVITSLYGSTPSPETHVEGNNQPRYTTKRLHDETAKARAYGLELAAAYHDDLAARHAAAHVDVVSDFHEMMERQHQRDASAIRALAATAAEGSDNA